MNILNNLLDAMNGREKALLTWGVIAFIFILVNRKTRSAVFDVIKAFLNIKIIAPFLAMFCYSGVLLWILSTVGFWNTTLLKDTLFWLFGIAIVLFFNTNKASQDPSLFRKMLLETVAFTVFLEFLANLYSFSFIVELSLMPILFLVVAMSALADGKDEYKIIRKPLRVILVGYGLFVLSYSVFTALSNLTRSLTVYNLLTLITPSVLTVMYLPFIYLFALIMAYELLFVRLDSLMRGDKELAKFTKKRMLISFRLNLWLINNFAQNSAADILKLKNKQDVVSMIGKY